MRHTARQPAYSVELLRLLELRFQLEALREVLRDIIVLGRAKLTFQFGNAIAKVPVLTFGHAYASLCWIILRG